MGLHLQRDIEALKRGLLTLSGVVEQRVVDAVRSLEKKDVRLAQSVIDGDLEIDEQEVALEEECLKILALHQPVAVDLRFLIAVLKINSDLERIGDLAVGIADKAQEFAEQQRLRLPEHIGEMSARTKAMLDRALDALIEMDTAEAESVLVADDEVDELHRRSYDFVEERVRSDPDGVSDYVRLLGISRNLERIADHTTNIAEDVIYMIDGEIVRHRGDDAAVEAS